MNKLLNNLKKNFFFCRVTCECERKFQACLSTLDTMGSHYMYNLIFNVFKLQCLSRECPKGAKSCVKRELIFKWQDGPWWWLNFSTVPILGLYTFRVVYCAQTVPTATFLSAEECDVLKWCGQQLTSDDANQTVCILHWNKKSLPRYFIIRKKCFFHLLPEGNKKREKRSCTHHRGIFSTNWLVYH